MNYFIIIFFLVAVCLFFGLLLFNVVSGWRIGKDIIVKIGLVFGGVIVLTLVLLFIFMSLFG